MDYFRAERPNICSIRRYSIDRQHCGRGIDTYYLLGYGKVVYFAVTKDLALACIWCADTNVGRIIEPVYI